LSPNNWFKNSTCPEPCFKNSPEQNKSLKKSVNLLSSQKSEILLTTQFSNDSTGKKVKESTS
jgi:hypothetical protein